MESNLKKAKSRHLKRPAPARARTSAVVVYGDPIELRKLKAYVKTKRAKKLKVLGPKPLDAADGPSAHLEGAKQRSKVERDTDVILDRVQRWAGSRTEAIRWFRGQGIASLGDQTAESLVLAGQATLVRRYLDAIAAGGLLEQGPTHCV